MVKYVGERQIVVDDNPTPVPFWEPNRELFRNKTVIIIGGGPSISDVDWKFVSESGCGLIAVNSSCRVVSQIVEESDILYFSDNSWSEIYFNLILSWPGIILTSNRNTKARLGNLVNRLNLNDLTYFMQVKPDYVQASSGHTAACLAVYMGSKRLVLIGFECQAVNGKTHGHGDYEQGDIPAFEERFLPGWIGLGWRFKELGVEVVNSTPNSLIKEFEYTPLNKALEYV